MTEPTEQPKKIAILGSTGSIGKQALEVVSEQSSHFQVEVLTAGTNAELLIEQALQYQPNAVVIGDERKYEQVKDALWNAGIKVYAGRDALNQIVESTEVEMVLTAVVGSAGLEPTVRAIQSGKQIALANKETLVVAGEIVTELARKHAVNIYPVDSEHSAIFQCLAGEWNNPIEKIYLTASGGPFRGRTLNDLATVTLDQALKHPNWAMGAKITIDSATMMNKGLEVIEARWFFHLKPEQIDVIVHPQSIVHSLVQFRDGSMKAQMGLPDMKLPIQYAMAYPQRLANDFPRFDFMQYPQLTFEKPDLDTFRCLRLAYQAMEAGGNMPCVLNAANEMAVADFLEKKITFLQIAEQVEAAMQKCTFIAKPTIEDYYQSDAETRRVYVEANAS
jgi:1-deoxy-D-xylulose-5-phosphate reductoisomerase